MVHVQCHNFILDQQRSQIVLWWNTRFSRHFSLLLVAAPKTRRRTQSFGRQSSSSLFCGQFAICALVPPICLPTKHRRFITLKGTNLCFRQSAQGCVLHEDMLYYPAQIRRRILRVRAWHVDSASGPAESSRVSRHPAFCCFASMDCLGGNLSPL